MNITTQSGNILNPLEALLFCPGDKPAEQSGVGALGVLGLAALMPQVLQKIFNQRLHSLSPHHRGLPVSRS